MGTYLNITNFLGTKKWYHSISYVYIYLITSDSALFAAIVLEFCVRILTVLLPLPLKGIFYHSALVLLVSAIVGRYSAYCFTVCH